MSTVQVSFGPGCLMTTLAVAGGVVWVGTAVILRACFGPKRKWTTCRTHQPDRGEWCSACVAADALETNT